MNDPRAKLDPLQPKSEGSVPDLLVEKLALDELSEAAARSVRERLGDGAEARLAAIDASNAEIMEALPPTLIAAQISAQVARTGASGAQPAPSVGQWAPWLGLGGLAAAGMALWMFMSPTGSPNATDSGQGAMAATKEGPTQKEGPGKVARLTPPKGPPAGDTIRFKGGTKLSVSRSGQGGASALAAGAHVAPGDNLQVSYAAGDAQYGVIVSIDGAGAATLHWPETADGNTSLRGRANLAHGYELDDAPAFERFFFVTSDTKLSAGSVMDAARLLAKGDDARDGELVLRPEWAQQSLLLVK